MQAIAHRPGELGKLVRSGPNVFSRLYVSMVEAGEAAGILDPTMVFVFATLVLT